MIIPSIIFSFRDFAASGKIYCRLKKEKDVREATRFNRAGPSIG
jgi:hypothetical protein